MYIYNWGESTNIIWPGEKLIEQDGWYSKTFDSSISSLKILWNDFNNDVYFNGEKNQQIIN